MLNANESLIRATQAAERLMDDRNIRLRFISNEPNPYDEEGERKMDIFRDERGFEYWLDSDNRTLLQAGLSEDSDSTTHQAGQETRLPVTELRELAIRTAARMINGFEQRLSTLHPLEANDRRRVYFFRWEDLSEPLAETELPPFVQFGLYPDGSIAGYTDTLSVSLPVTPGDESENCVYPPQSWTKAER